MIIPRRKPYFEKDSLYNSLKFLLSQSYKNEIQLLESMLSKKLKIPNPIVVSSGRTGLRLILEESGIKKGTEIIMPGYTFGILTKTITTSGFVPRPIDIDDTTFQMSVKEISKAINKKTGAILATHLFGESCDIERIKRLAKKHKIFLIEDCAQSLGATKKGNVVGTFGEISISSFNIAKPLQGITGGLVFGKNKIIINKIRNRVDKSKPNIGDFAGESLRSLIGFFISQTFLWPIIMFLFSFESFQIMFVSIYRSMENKKSLDKKVKKIKSISLHPLFAYLIRTNLKTFKERVKERRDVRSKYMNKLSGYINFQKIEQRDRGVVDMLVGTTNIDVLKLRRYLSFRGIDIAIKNEIADDCLNDKNSKIKSVYDSSIALPVYEGMTNKEIDFVVKNIKNFIKSNLISS